MLSAAMLAAGVLLLWKGGDLLVEGADRFARGRGMPSSLAGVFILGFATSAPELFTSVLAALRGYPGIASGNVIGSNVANVALILGIAAALGTVVVDRFLRRYEMPIAILASIAAWVLFADGTFSRLDGGIFVLVFAAYVLFAVRTAPHRPLPPPPDGLHRPLLELGMTVLGLAGVLGGAHLFLEGSIDVARWLGVSETVIGLTLVALGTSLPELATTVAAARTNRMELAVGNVVGSNIFNLLLVLGTAAMMNPQPAEARLFEVDLPLMTGLAVLVWVFALPAHRLLRWQGWLFLAVYVGYLLLITVQSAT